MSYHDKVLLYVVFVHGGDLYLGDIHSWAAGQRGPAHPEHAQPQRQRDEGDKRDPVIQSIKC